MLCALWDHVFAWLFIRGQHVSPMCLHGYSSVGNTCLPGFHACACHILSAWALGEALEAPLWLFYFLAHPNYANYCKVLHEMAGE